MYNIYYIFGFFFHSSKHGLYTKSKNLAMDGDDDDEDLRDGELMKMYEVCQNLCIKKISGFKKKC